MHSVQFHTVMRLLIGEMRCGTLGELGCNGSASKSCAMMRKMGMRFVSISADNYTFQHLMLVGEWDEMRMMGPVMSVLTSFNAMPAKIDKGTKWPTFLAPCRKWRRRNPVASHFCSLIISRVSPRVPTTLDEIFQVGDGSWVTGTIGVTHTLCGESRTGWGR